MTVGALSPFMPLIAYDSTIRGNADLSVSIDHAFARIPDFLPTVWSRVPQHHALAAARLAGVLFVVDGESAAATPLRFARTSGSLIRRPLATARGRLSSPGTSTQKRGKGRGPDGAGRNKPLLRC
jgi:hypothetical protein